MSIGEAALRSASPGQVEASRERRTFYPTMAAVLLAFVLLGFGRTLYLRAFFDVPTLSAFVWAHGVALTLWFVGFFLQTALVAAGRVVVHRRVGWAVAALGLAVVATSTGITFDVAAAMAASGIPRDVVLQLAPRIAWGNLSAVFTFAVLLAAAVLLRRSNQSHKRLMLLASISIITPAVARIFRWTLFGESINGAFSAWAIVVAFVLVLVVAAHDLRTRGRLHSATLAGGAFLVAVKVVAVLLIPATALGPWVVRGGE